MRRKLTTEESYCEAWAEACRILYHEDSLGQGELLYRLKELVALYGDPNQPNIRKIITVPDGRYTLQGDGDRFEDNPS